MRYLLFSEPLSSPTPPPPSPFTLFSLCAVYPVHFVQFFPRVSLKSLPRSSSDNLLLCCPPRPVGHWFVGFVGMFSHFFIFFSPVSVVLSSARLGPTEGRTGWGFCNLGYRANLRAFEFVFLPHVGLEKRCLDRASRFRTAPLRARLEMKMQHKNNSRNSVVSTVVNAAIQTPSDPRMGLRIPLPVGMYRRIYPKLPSLVAPR